MAENPFKPYSLFLKITALLIPFYFIYYGPLHDQPKNPENRLLLKYVYFGFFMYVIIFFFLIYYNYLVNIV